MISGAERKSGKGQRRGRLREELTHTTSIPPPTQCLYASTHLVHVESSSKRFPVSLRWKAFCFSSSTDPQPSRVRCTVSCPLSLRHHNILHCFGWKFLGRTTQSGQLFNKLLEWKAKDGRYAFLDAVFTFQCGTQYIWNTWAERLITLKSGN